MATQTTANFCDCSTAANFRAWASMVSTAMASGGFVKTGDTGQINLVTVVTNGASAGYEIWRFADTLQGTAPFFIKIEYGNSSNTPNMWYTFGTASNGSGTLTGNTSTRFGVSGGLNSSATQQNSYFSYAADGSRFVMNLFDGPLSGGTANAYNFLVSFERTVDATGAANSDGLVAYVYCPNAPISNNTKSITDTSQAGGVLVLPSTGSIPAGSSYFPVVMSPTGSLSDGTNVSLVFPIPIGARAYNPVYNVAVFMGTDFAFFQTINTVPVYGSNHTYKAIGSYTVTARQPFSAFATVSVAANVAYRWE